MVVHQLVDKGFTLLEMLLSVFVISTITWLVTYNIIEVNYRKELSEATKMVVVYLEGAKNCSIASNLESEVIFDKQVMVQTCVNINNGYEYPNVEITTNFNQDTVSFTKRGTVKKGGTVTICNKIKCNYVTIGVGNSDIRIK